jgi:nitrogen fixation protein NifU and related proteins
MTIDRSTPPIDSLFQELILEHYKHPRNKGTLEEPRVEVHMHNPVCGDELWLHLRLDEEGRIGELRFRGQGCSISQASISMMTQLLKGKSPQEAAALAERFTEMMHGDPEAARDRAMGDLRALAGVSKFAARVKCALLGWNAAEEALKQAAGE